MFDVIGRRGRVNQARAQVEVARGALGEDEILLKSQIIEHWSDLIGWEKIYHERMRDVQVQTLNLQIVEKEFREGAAQHAEVGRISAVLSDATANLGIARRNIIYAYNQLQLLVGVKLVTIKKRDAGSPPKR
jgi:outer membrane protein TolC